MPVPDPIRPLALFALLSAQLASPAATPPPLTFPTPNRALLEPGGEERYFTGTAGHPWTHGMFGCTRTQGWQMHEGIDIRSLERDARGEPADPVYATADGSVAYVNPVAGRSNYGIYVVLRHHLGGLEVFSLYAHLAEVRAGLQPGQNLRAGETFARMGRTANTAGGIAKDRAHLHFELVLMVNARYPDFLRQKTPGARNYHDVWNGQNFLGLDPRILLLSAHRFPDNFDLARYLRVQTELCRVAVRVKDFDYLRRYPMLVLPRPEVAPDAIAGYELHLDYTGVPVRLIPRTEAELPGKADFTLLQVNEEEYANNPCRRLVVKRGQEFELGPNGRSLLELLAF